MVKLDLLPITTRQNFFGAMPPTLCVYLLHLSHRSTRNWLSQAYLTTKFTLIPKLWRVFTNSYATIPFHLLFLSLKNYLISLPVCLPIFFITLFLKVLIMNQSIRSTLPSLRFIRSVRLCKSFSYFFVYFVQSQSLPHTWEKKI